MKLMSSLALFTLLLTGACSHHKSCCNQADKEKMMCAKEKCDKPCCDKDKKCSDGSCAKEKENCTDGSCDKKKKQ